MSKKKEFNSDMNENEEMDPIESNAQMEGSTSDKSEAGTSTDSQDESEAVQQVETSDNEVEEVISPEDLLDDVRRSLITDTLEKDEAEQSKWWKRIGKGSKKNKEAAPRQPEIAEAAVESPVDVTAEQVDEPEEYVEQLDELIDMLEDDHEVDADETDASTHQLDEESPAKEQAVSEAVDFDELKKRAFYSRPTTEPEEEERSLSEVRSVAMDDGEEVFVEVEAKAEDPFRDRMKAIENAFMPYRQYLNFIFIFVSLVMVVIVSASLYRLYQRSLPPPPVEDVSLLPYPVGINLPGDLKFNLGKGKLQEGRWNPAGPEWLEGTEICRWIAIPYSRQLEAVVRTFTREDQIELIMSNNDELKYTVNSIDQMSIDDMQKLDANSPCMLLVLAQSDTDERWVVTAIP